MKRKLHLTAATLVSFFIAGCSGKETQSFDAIGAEREIRELLELQETAWNNGNIEEFMNGYWKSDSLKFIGAAVTSGWQATLDRYLSRYPDRAAMGQLTFEFYRFHFVDENSCLVTGRYRLKREADEPTGLFTLLVKKMDGLWVIVYDHTS